MSSQETRQTISLAGAWNVCLDPDDVGVREEWQRQSPDANKDTLQLPGSLQAQGFGNNPSEETRWTAGLFPHDWHKLPAYTKMSDDAPFRLPYFLLPDREYVGPAWYSRSIYIPADWIGKRIELTLERPHWQTRVWLDGVDLGTNDSLGTPHRYDLPAGLAPGAHTLVIRVDNRLIVDVGRNAHSVSDHTQTNWNGLIGELSLTATPPVWLKDVQIDCRDTKSLRVEIQIGNMTGQVGSGRVLFNDQTYDVSWDIQGGSAAPDVTIDDVGVWDEFTPAVHQAVVGLLCEHGHDVLRIDYGIRRLDADGLQVRINGRPICFRGTLDCCVFPNTGYPPTDTGSWEKVFRACHAYGLNHVRFHSWCPPRAAFTAADRAGIYCQIECGVWANHDGVTLGDGADVDGWIIREADRILREYGNHPSFVLFAHGNEPGGQNAKAYLSSLVARWRQHDSRRLYAGATGWASVEADQYFPVMQVWEKVPARGQGGWHGGDYREAIGAAKRPVISHEIGQHCVYPAFAETVKYTGHIRPTNYDIFRDSLEASGMIQQADEFVEASGALQALCYKEDIEAALRTPGMAGFQLLGLSDFPGQGTAMVGVLDAFWEPKPHIDGRAFSRFCGPTVPLARLTKRVLVKFEPLTMDAEIAHFGPEPIKAARPVWRLECSNSGDILASGELPTRDIPIGNNISLGTVRITLDSFPAPVQLRLVLGLKGTDISNGWNVWLYDDAATQPATDKVRVADRFGPEEQLYVEAGGRLLLLPPPQTLSERHPNGSFIPVFWNRLLMKDQPGQTLGLLCRPTHPALAGFPTDQNADWQWQDLCESARYLVLDSLPPALLPIVQPIDDWNTNRRLGLVFECRVGRGRILICSADLCHGLDKRPAARQLRFSLTTYLNQNELAPAVRIDADILADLVRPSSTVKPRISFDPSIVPMTETGPSES